MLLKTPSDTTAAPVKGALAKLLLNVRSPFTTVVLLDCVAHGAGARRVLVLVLPPHAGNNSVDARIMAPRDTLVESLLRFTHASVGGFDGSRLSPHALTCPGAKIPCGNWAPGDAQMRG